MFSSQVSHFGQFTQFPKLPTEVSQIFREINLAQIIPGGEGRLTPTSSSQLRLIIWKLAMAPRLVGFTKSTNRLPGIFHANQEARSASKYSFEMMDFGTGLFLNPEIDILLLDKASFSKQLHYHGSGMHTLNCGGFRDSTAPLTKRIERVAISAQEVLSIQSFEGHPHSRAGGLLGEFRFLLEDRFPALKEVIIILRRGPIGATAEGKFLSGFYLAKSVY